MMAFLFSLYSLGMGYYSGAGTAYLGMFSAVAIFSLLATYYKNQLAMLSAIFADAILLSMNIEFKNIFEPNMAIYIVAIVIPMLIAIEHSMNMARGLEIPKNKSPDRMKYFLPLAYVVVTALSLYTISRIDLYEIYFLGEEQATMQILLITGLGALFFMPIYEFISARHKR